MCPVLLRVKSTCSCLCETEVYLSSVVEGEVYMSVVGEDEVYLSCLVEGLVDSMECEVVADVPVPLRVVRGDDRAKLGVGLGIVARDAAGGVAVQDEGVLLGAQLVWWRGGRRAVDLVHPAPGIARGSSLCLRHLAEVTVTSATVASSHCKHLPLAHPASCLCHDTAGCATAVKTGVVPMCS